MAANAATDFAIIGGGIVGCAAAALLAEAGSSVLLAEREAIGAAASGRNSGALQHPFDPELGPFHHESVHLYRRLAAELPELFALAEEPHGLLLLSDDEQLVSALAAGFAGEVPELAARFVGHEELAGLEPQLADGLCACRLHTAWTIPPASATRAFSELAVRGGARLVIGTEARPWIEDGAARGIVLGGERIPAGAVLCAGGPWTPALLTGLARVPIEPVWGVNVQVVLPDPPHHVLEQAGVEMANPAASAVAGDHEPAADLPSLFSLVTAGGASTLGSTVLRHEPSPSELAEPLRERGTAFVPALRDARLVDTRVCPRPQSRDGRPLVGRVPGVEGLHVAAGHGPWGISIGPATARLAVDVLLGRPVEVPAALDAARFAG